MPADAPKAMQWLALGGSTASSAFKVQKDGMNNLEEVIRSMLNVPSSHAHPRDGTIKLQRRVFTKVSGLYLSVGSAHLQTGPRRYSEDSHQTG